MLKEASEHYWPVIIRRPVQYFKTKSANLWCISLAWWPHGPGSVPYVCQGLTCWPVRELMTTRCIIRQGRWAVQHHLPCQPIVLWQTHLTCDLEDSHPPPLFNVKPDNSVWDQVWRNLTMVYQDKRSHQIGHRVWVPPGTVALLSRVFLKNVGHKKMLAIK